MRDTARAAAGRSGERELADPQLRVAVRHERDLLGGAAAGGLTGRRERRRGGGVDLSGPAH